MAKSNTYGNLQQRRRIPKQLPVATFQRLVGKVLSIAEEKGVNFADSVLDQALGSDFATNDHLRDKSTYIITAVVCDVLGIQPQDCIPLGRSKTTVSYKASPQKYHMLNLVARFICQYTRNSYLKEMQEMFYVTAKYSSSHKNGKYFTDKTISVTLVPEYSRVIMPTVIMKSLPKPAYMSGKEIFVEELVDKLIFSITNYGKFCPADQNSIRPYIDKVEKNAEIIKTAVITNSNQ